MWGKRTGRDHPHGSLDSSLQQLDVLSFFSSPAVQDVPSDGGGGGSRVLQSGRAAVWQKLTLPSGGHAKPEGTELFALKPPPPQMRLGMSL